MPSGRRIFCTACRIPPPRRTPRDGSWPSRTPSSSTAMPLAGSGFLNSAASSLRLGRPPSPGSSSFLRCKTTVGAEQAMLTALAIVRPGGAVGRVGVPHYEGIPGTREMFYDNISVGGGPAPVRAYIKELLPDVLAGKIEPGRVFDRTISLDEVPDGYKAM